jgi:hypothetical protein
MSRHSDIGRIYSKNPIGDSIIYFDIDFDDLVETEALGEGDPWVIRAVYSDNDYDLDEYEVAKDNWLDGGWLSNFIFRDNAKEKYYELIKKLKPDFNFSTAGEGAWSDVNDIMFTYFRQEVDEILTEYVSLRNEEVKLATKDAVEKETKAAFDPYGIRVDWEDETISLKASTLYSLMRMENIYALGAKDSIQKIISEILIDAKFAGFDESRYEFENIEYFDRDQMTEVSVKHLENMIEKLDENIESYTKFNTIMNKFGFDINSVTKRDLGNDIKVQILDFNPNKNVVRMKVSTPSHYLKGLNVDINDFEEFLNNPKGFI